MGELNWRDTSVTDVTSESLVANASALFKQLVSVYPKEVPTLAGTVMDKIAACIHELNCRAGWWTDLGTGERAKRNFGELLMLIVSEIAEGAEGWRNVHMDDKLPDYPMLDVELGDGLIRVFDTSAGCGFCFMYELERFTADDWAEVLAERISFMDHAMAAVGFLAEALEADRKKLKSEAVDPAAKPLAKFILFLCAWIRQEGFRTTQAFGDKLTYNLHRLDHKPESRRTGAGPSY